MASVYILYSQKLNKFYIGSCKEYNDRFQDLFFPDIYKSFTARAGDWQPFLIVENLSYLQARSVEAHIKRMKSKTFIKNLQLYPELLEKLIEKYR